jgi:uncharacterized membrane protein
VHESDGPEGQYLEQLRVHLRGIAPAERDEIVREIASHLAEARADGRDETEVLGRLGPPERLARSYQTDAILNGRGTGPSLFSVFRAALPMLSTSLASILIVPLLVATGVGLTVAGAATIAAGILSFVMPGLVRVDPSTPLGQVLALGVGLIAVAVGLLSIRGLRWYLRLTARVLRRGLLPIG